MYHNWDSDTKMDNNDNISNISQNNILHSDNTDDDNSDDSNDSSNIINNTININNNNTSNGMNKIMNNIDNNSDDLLKQATKISDINIDINNFEQSLNDWEKENKNDNMSNDINNSKTKTHIQEMNMISEKMKKEKQFIRNVYKTNYEEMMDTFQNSIKEKDATLCTIPLICPDYLKEVSIDSSDLIYNIIFLINENIKTKDNTGKIVTKNDLYNHLMLEQAINNYEFTDIINLLIRLNLINETCDMPSLYSFNWDLLINMELMFTKFVKTFGVFNLQIHKNKFWIG